MRTFGLHNHSPALIGRVLRLRTISSSSASLRKLHTLTPTHRHTIVFQAMPPKTKPQMPGPTLPQSSKRTHPGRQDSHLSTGLSTTVPQLPESMLSQASNQLEQDLLTIQLATISLRCNQLLLERMPLQLHKLRKGDHPGRMLPQLGRARTPLTTTGKTGP